MTSLPITNIMCLPLQSWTLTLTASHWVAQVCLEPVSLLPQPQVLGLRRSPCVVSHEHFSLEWKHCELQLKLASSFGLLIKTTFPTMMTTVHRQLEGISHLGDTWANWERKPTWLEEPRQAFLSASWPQTQKQILLNPAAMVSTPTDFCSPSMSQRDRSSWKSFCLAVHHSAKRNC